MGNKHSDQAEKRAYNVIKFVPLVGPLYGVGRMAAYAGNGNLEEAVETFGGKGAGAQYAPPRHQWMPLSQIKDVAEPGEIIEFGDHRFGLFIGDGETAFVGDDGVVYVDRFIPGPAGDCMTGRVRKMEEYDFIAFNYFLRHAQPISGFITAVKSGLMEVPFEAELRNSEYYATLWRYGIGFSPYVMESKTRAWEEENTGKAIFQKILQMDGITEMTNEMAMVAIYKEIADKWLI